VTDDRAFELELEIEVVGTPDEVWRAIATGAGVSPWLQPTEIEERVGGRFAYDLGDQGHWNETGEVSEHDRPFRFSTRGVRWQGPRGPDDTALIATQWMIEPSDNGTCVVRLVMSGFKRTGEWDDEVGGVRNGMLRAMEALADHLVANPGR
jgi:uncharacterized protein YndB with AHSA1/START domain